MGEETPTPRILTESEIAKLKTIGPTIMGPGGQK